MGIEAKTIMRGVPFNCKTPQQAREKNRRPKNNKTDELPQPAYKRNSLSGGSKTISTCGMADPEEHLEGVRRLGPSQMPLHSQKIPMFAPSLTL